MAGSGKTCVVQRLIGHMQARGAPPYVLNLDPAVRNLPYEPHIDIRDTVFARKSRLACTLRRSTTRR